MNTLNVYNIFFYILRVSIGFLSKSTLRSGCSQVGSCLWQLCGISCKSKMSLAEFSTVPITCCPPIPPLAAHLGAGIPVHAHSPNLS